MSMADEGLFLQEHNDEHSYSTSNDGTGTDTTNAPTLRLALILATLAIGAAVTMLAFIWLKKGNTEQGQNVVRTEM